MRAVDTMHQRPHICRSTRTGDEHKIALKPPPPRHSPSKRSRGSATMRLAASKTICKGMSRLAAAVSGIPNATQMEPLLATPANASVIPTSARASCSSDGLAITLGKSRATERISGGSHSPAATTMLRAPFVALSSASKTAAGDADTRSTVAAASRAFVRKRSASGGDWFVAIRLRESLDRRARRKRRFLSAGNCTELTVQRTGEKKKDGVVNIQAHFVPRFRRPAPIAVILPATSRSSPISQRTILRVQFPAPSS